jgi:hypothetical protein
VGIAISEIGAGFATTTKMKLKKVNSLLQPWIEKATQE